MIHYAKNQGCVLTYGEAAIARISEAAWSSISKYCCFCSSLVVFRSFWSIVSDCCRLRNHGWVLTYEAAAITRISDAAVRSILLICCICSSLVAFCCFWSIVTDCCRLRNKSCVLTYGEAATTRTSDAAVCSILLFCCIYSSLVVFRCFWSVVSP